MGRWGRHKRGGPHRSREEFVLRPRKIGWICLLRGQISADWETVINDERIENGLKAHTRANVKVFREIIQIILNLWRRRCEILFGKTKEAKIKNKRDQLTKKIDN